MFVSAVFVIATDVTDVSINSKIKQGIYPYNGIPYSDFHSFIQLTNI